MAKQPNSRKFRLRDRERPLVTGVSNVVMQPTDSSAVYVKSARVVTILGRERVLWSTRKVESK